MHASGCRRAAIRTVGRVIAVFLVIWCPLPPAAHGTPSAADGRGPAEIGAPRPALELDAIDGALVNDARVADRPLVVDFFATWCEPCGRALADMTAAKHAAAADIVLVLVDLGEPSDVVQRWMATARLPANAIVALDPTGIVARRWGAHRIPTTFVVDGAGVVRHINRGWGPGYRARLSRWLRDVAASPPARSRP